MPAIDNLVHETSTSTGTGSFTLSAADGRQSFDAAFGTGGTDAFYYFLSHRTAGEWEVGTGHLSNATTLVRDTVLASSNANAAVDFSVGTKDVTNDLPASQAANQILTTRGDLLLRGTTDPQRLGVGALGEVLRSDGSDPYWGEKHAVKVRLTNGVDQTIPSNTASVVELDEVDFDFGGYFDTINHRWCPRPGIYLISCNPRFATTNGVDKESLRLFFRRDGNDIGLFDSRRSGTGGQTIWGTTLVEMDGTHVLQVIVSKGGAGSGDLEATTSTTNFNAHHVRDIEVGGLKFNEDEYVAATGTGASITIPPAARAGDFCMIFNKAEGTTGNIPANMAPNGFSTLKTDNTASGSNNVTRSSVFAKVLTENDPGSSVSGLDGNVEEEWIAIVLLANKTPSGFTDNSGGADGRTSNPPPQTIVASGEINKPIVAYALYSSTGAVDPRSSTVSMNEEQGASTDLYAKFIVYNDGDAPADIDVDMNDEGTINVLI